MPVSLTRFPIRCGWSDSYAVQCPHPAALAVTTGCPVNARDAREDLTCTSHLAMFEDRAAATGYHFIKVCCDGTGEPGDHGAVILSTRPLNEGDLP